MRKVRKRKKNAYSSMKVNCLPYVSTPIDMTSPDKFRFHLEARDDKPHSMGKAKHTCPGCGRKTFTRYIDRETGKYLADDCGKCDRLNNCGYHYPPRELFRDRPECRPDNERGAERSFYRERTDWLTGEQGFEAVYDYIPQKLIPYNLQPVNIRSRFFFWLLGLFDRYSLESPTALRILGDYGLGATADGRVLFYQIYGRQVRTAKIMDYDKETGHRRGAPSWLHNLPEIRKHYPRGFRLCQCLFGAHLLTEYPRKPVGVVEAEKTACVLSGLFPGTLWLATGGATVNMNRESLSLLAGRRVTFYPDASPGDRILEDWKFRAHSFMPPDSVFVISNLLAGDRITEADKEKGIDLADLYIK